MLINKIWKYNLDSGVEYLSILNNYNIGEIILNEHKDFIFDLLKYHPNDVNNENIDFITVELDKNKETWNMSTKKCI